MKDILIVTEDMVGIMKALQEGIRNYTNFSFDYIDHYAIRESFRYKNIGHRTRNFFLKNLSGRNLKHEHYNTSIEEAITRHQVKYKKILVIRPDRLTDSHLQILRNTTDCLIAYYWDTVDFFPRKGDIIHYFDRILSFDPEDCKKYGFEFQPNFYYYKAEPAEIKYEVYNLSSYDHRRPVIEQIARELEVLGISYLFKGFHNKPYKNPYIQYTTRISYQQMIGEANQGNVILDVTKAGQNGLNFRPFEALGLNKKLITTNAGIREYSFYDPQNILIVNPERPHINADFFKWPYKMVPEAIKKEFHVQAWLKKVFS